MTAKLEKTDTKDQEAQRIDKWLFHARFIKSRARATKLVNAKKLRINGEKISKASYNIRIGDILTFHLNEQIKMILILGINQTRRPFIEAQKLYDDQSPEPTREKQDILMDIKPIMRDTGAGRPTKKQRRQTDQFIMDALDF